MANLFDLGVLVLVVIFGMFGFRDGLIKGAVKLAGFIAILVLLTVYSDQITALAISMDLMPPQFAVPIAFVVLFCLGVIAVHVIALALSGAVALTPAHGLDVGLGCAFGILKALFLGGLVALALSYGNPDSLINRQYRTSRFAIPLHQFVITTFPLLRTAAVSIYQRFEESLPDIEHEPPDYLNDADPADFI